MTPLESVRERYRIDPTFRAYVDAMRKAIVELHLTPGELRDAAVLAATLEEERRPVPLVATPIAPDHHGGPYR